MSIIERLVWALAGLVVLGVVLVIALPAFGLRVGRSATSDEAAWEDFKIANARYANELGEIQLPVERGGSHAAPPGPGQGTAAPTSPESPGSRDSADEREPPAEASRGDHVRAGTGSQRGSGGIGSGSPPAPAIVLPSSVIDKYRHVTDGMDALQSAESWDIDHEGRPAIQVGRMEDGSPLRRFLGLQPGDIVVSVNGHGVSRASGGDLFERLKDEQRFEVIIVRDRTPRTMTYEVR